MTDKETGEMIDLTKEDMDAVERAFAKEEAEERFERWLDRIWNAVLALGALAFLALVWWLVREKELADMEERRRDPQGAAARAWRAAGGEAPFRVCRAAARAVFLLPIEELGISPAPWRWDDDERSDDMVLSASDGRVAEWMDAKDARPGEEADDE